MLQNNIGSSQIRQLHVYPCNTSDVSFASSLRSQGENLRFLNVSTSSKKSIPMSTKNDESYNIDSYTLCTRPSALKASCIMIRKEPPSNNDYIPPRRVKSSLNVNRIKDFNVQNDLSTIEPVKLKPFTGAKKSKAINSIYDVLRQVDKETEFGSIPIKKRKKKWIRTIHDLL